MACFINFIFWNDRMRNFGIYCVLYISVWMDGWMDGEEDFGARFCVYG